MGLKSKKIQSESSLEDSDDAHENPVTCADYKSTEHHSMSNSSENKEKFPLAEEIIVILFSACI